MQATVSEGVQRYHWPEYYLEFPYFSQDIMRHHCCPERRVHTESSGKSLVLVHGLTDSPYFMSAIADFFYTSLQYNVYSVLLQGHCLKNPQGMSNISLAEWKRNVEFGIQTAASSGDRVSIGGLSTGGSLSLYGGVTNPLVGGEIYLFSPAISLYNLGVPFLGKVIEYLLTKRIIVQFERSKPLVGKNPYRYEYIPLHSAGELVKLIRELAKLQKTICQKESIDKRIFAVWTEADKVVSIRAIQKLAQITKGGNFVPFVIPKRLRVSHACEVLKKPIFAVGSKKVILQEANPLFDEMMDSVKKFDHKGG